MRCTARLVAAATVVLAFPLAASAAAGVRVLSDARDPERTLFPSDRFTVLDFTQNTFLRVHLPKPDCAAQPIACEDIDVLNTLDGFNPQPRLTIPFSGAIDVASVTSDTVFLVSLGSTVSDQGYMPAGTVVGINQVVWDTFTTTLHIESEALLAQHTRFALIVTSGVRDQGGARVGASEAFRRFPIRADLPMTFLVRRGKHVNGHVVTPIVHG